MIEKKMLCIRVWIIEFFIFYEKVYYWMVCFIDFNYFYGINVKIVYYNLYCSE